MAQPPSKRGLAAIVGAGAAAALLLFTPAQEGTVYKTYKDVGGVLTYCTGATEDAAEGKTYTPLQCREQLDKDLTRHAEGVMLCIHVPLTEGQKIAFVDTAYNIGTYAFCNSSMVRLTNAGDNRGGCAALKRWVKVGARTVQGLVNRREKVYALCMKDV